MSKKNEHSQAQETLQRLATVGELSAGIVHQARNLMTGALSFAQVGRSRAREQPEVEELFGRIEGELLKCIDMFQQLLVAARDTDPGTRGRTLEMVSESPAAIIAAVERLTRNHLRINGLRLTVEVEGSLPEVVVALDVVVQALLNLVVNAMHASPNDGTVHLNARRANGRVVITVRDEGEGVPEELRENIFKQFFTTKETGVGTGLGLPTSRAQLRAIGGDLELAESAGGGAIFIVSLPTEAGS